MLQLRLLVLAIAVLAVGVVIGMGMSLGGSQPASADDLEMDAQAFLDAFCSSTAIPADTEVEINDFCWNTIPRRRYPKRGGRLFPYGNRRILPP